MKARLPIETPVKAADTRPDYRIGALPSVEPRRLDLRAFKRNPKIFHSLTPAPGVEPTYEWTTRSDLNDLDEPATDAAPLVDVLVEPADRSPGSLDHINALHGRVQTLGSDNEETLPPLQQELFSHGGSYLYCPEGDRLGWPCHEGTSHTRLRLPEGWQKPRPWTCFAEFLGADAVKQYPLLKWCGPGATSWEPRLVGYGDYQVFAFGFEVGDERLDAVGHQLRLDLDLRLTGTERLHLQFRPIGEENTGGSFYRFNDPSGYIDNSTGEPDRYWIEGELFSIFSGWLDPFAVRDYHVLAGRFPYALHNTLLINDEIIGLVASKNTIYCGRLSNLNIQAILGLNDVDTYPDQQTRIYGVHATADRRRSLLEASYVFAQAERTSNRDAHYLAFSGTKLVGPCTFAVRSMFKFGDEGGTGDGELYVLEANRVRVWEEKPCGIESGVFYANLFGATKGWNSLGGSNFNRLRSAFEVNPLIAISSGLAPSDDIWGIAGGVQLFRHHEDESIIPELALQGVGGQSVWGTGLRYLRKTGPRTFFEMLGLANFSDRRELRREGIFLACTYLL